MVSAGRLDVDSRGLLVLTNDGELANRIMHPKFEINKVYETTSNSIIDDKSLESLRKGIILDGKKTKPAKIEIISRTKQKTVLQIIIHEGRNRQIRRMFSLIGHGVADLVRTNLGNLSLKGLGEGEIMKLTERELAELRKILKMN